MEMGLPSQTPGDSAPLDNEMSCSKNLGSSKLEQQRQAKSRSNKMRQKLHSCSGGCGVSQQALSAELQCSKNIQNCSSPRVGLGSCSPAPKHGQERLPWSGGEGLGVLRFPLRHPRR